jgi:carbonic anhydrase
LVMGHSRCGAVTTAVQTASLNDSAVKQTGCEHVEPVLREIRESIDPNKLRRLDRSSPEAHEAFVDEVARANVMRSVDKMLDASDTLRKLVESGSVAVVGAFYDVATGELTFLTPHDAEPIPHLRAIAEPA